MKEYSPRVLEITNQSHLHAHHAAMRDQPKGEGAETHFKIVVRSQVFEGMGQMQRHRRLYRTLKQELEGGVHALSMDLA